ncbi:FAD:protein FMN transferase [Actinotalea sp.]|uniref:FAD:protein FMN transferase n=1 Tax=Actinotalea sp. TaxID=1872145 RepID=UPI0035684B61
MSTATLAAAAGSTTAAPAQAQSRAWVEHIMGMPISVHVRGPQARTPEVASAVAAAMDDLREIEARFSTYRHDSEISRIQHGELTLEDASTQVRQVELLCRAALERTGGWFDAWNAVPGMPGVFDPTGLVKTFGVTWAARHLDAFAPTLGYAFGAGGDIQLRAAPDSEPWQVGIEDPRDQTRVLAHVPVSDGAVATSGSASRGAHIMDPHTGAAAEGLLSATVIGPSLLWADVLATAAVARGAGAAEWVGTLHGTSGMLVTTSGAVHRWSNPV